MADFNKHKNTAFLNDIFSIELLRNVSNVLKSFEKRKGYKLGSNNHHLLTEREKYDSRVFQIHDKLAKSCKDLILIRTFLNRNPLKKIYLQKGISELDYIQYHTEVLFHKIHTILEIMKLLLNEVYQLGILPKDCSWITLSGKLSKSTSSMKSLERYFTTFKNLIDLRHSNTHRGYYEDEEKDDIELKFGYAFLKMHQGILISNVDLIDPASVSLIKFKIKEHKTNRVKLLDTCIEENEKLVSNFLATLLPQYRKQIAVF